VLRAVRPLALTLSLTHPPLPFAAQAVRTLASEFLRDAVRVNIGSDVLSANHRVSQVGVDWTAL
jgi:hypothetical protein